MQPACISIQLCADVSLDQLDRHFLPHSDAFRDKLQSRVAFRVIIRTLAVVGKKRKSVGNESEFILCFSRIGLLNLNLLVQIKLFI